MTLQCRSGVSSFYSLSVFALVCSNVVGAARSWSASPIGRQSVKRAATAAISVGATETLTEQKTRILTDDDEFLRPEQDKRKYRTLKLANNLEVLLVSDQLAEGAVGVEAGSVHVQAGHFDDTLPGLAHFHEHMLFLGTEKYPKEDDYETFLSQFAGFSNAYTDMEDTNYYFSVTTKNGQSNQTSAALRGALDRLAQFFIAPTFNPDSVERETRAIDSEYRNGKTSENWRTFQIVKSTCNPLHPFAKFGCGNYETLQGEGLEKLLSELHLFWETYYRTYNLRLAVIGHATLNALQATVEETFGELKFSEGSPRRLKNVEGQDFVRENAVYTETAYRTQELQKLRRIIPIIETRSIKILFGTPPLDDPELLNTKPYRVLSHILGHEGPGSLHAVLNDLGYLNDLTSGIGIDTSDFSLFSLTLSLTPKGMQNHEEVLKLVFDWLALLRQNQGLLQPYHDELQQISDMNFRFRENGDPTDFCSSASELLFDEDLDHGRLLKGGSETMAFVPETVEKFLDRLRASNCMIHLTSSDFKVSDGRTWETEKWYGGQFQVEEFEESQLSEWENPVAIDARLVFPKLNEYIPSDFTLCSDGSVSSSPEIRKREVEIAPTVILEEPTIRLWHKMDKVWNVPKAFIRVGILSPHVYSTPRTMTYNRIFQRMLNDDLNSYVYDASLAGCNYRVSCVPTGYRFSVTGYNEKLPFLFDVLTSRIHTLIDEMKHGDQSLQDRFDKAKEGLLRETKNYRVDSPYEVASYNSRLLMEQNVWYLDSYINEMEGESADANPLTMKDCAETAQQSLTGSIRSEVLCMGNIDSEDAHRVAKVLKQKFLDKARPVTEVEIPRHRSMKLPTKEESEVIFGAGAGTRGAPLIYAELAYSESEENSSVELIMQVGSELEMGYAGLATLDLITHMAYNSAFNQLRTKEQLGYTVSAFPRKTVGASWGMSVLVMGSGTDPAYMEERIESWLQQFRQELQDMSPESIALEAEAIISQLLEDETKMSQEASRVWGEILNTETLTDSLRTPNFDRLKLLANELGTGPGSKLTPEDLKRRVIQFFDERLLSSSTERRAMSSRVYSQDMKKEYDGIRQHPWVLTSHDDIREVKEYLSSWPTAPYWRIKMSDQTTSDAAQNAASET